MWIQSVCASEIHCIERLRKYQKIHFIKISKNLPLTLIKHEIVECLMARRVSKDENKNTKWENNRDKDGYMTLKIWKKQSLQSGINSAMFVATWFICNLLLKTQNMPEI